jgi:hypothetical protein
MPTTAWAPNAVDAVLADAGLTICGLTLLKERIEDGSLTPRRISPDK